MYLCCHHVAPSAGNDGCEEGWHGVGKGRAFSRKPRTVMSSMNGSLSLSSPARFDLLGVGKDCDADCGDYDDDGGGGGKGAERQPAEDR